MLRRVFACVLACYGLVARSDGLFPDEYIPENPATRFGLRVHGLPLGIPFNGDRKEPDNFGLTNREMSFFGKMSACFEFKNHRDGITQWNSGESFASVGLGHYLWGKSFKDDSLRAMIRYMHTSKCYTGTYPKILNFKDGEIGKVAWKNRSDLNSKLASADTVELQDFLWRDDIQQCEVNFHAHRLHEALDNMMKKEKGNKEFSKYVESMIDKPAGLLAMLDYVNFKGEGLGSSMSKGWGLYQVLKSASSLNKESNPINRFKVGAISCLQNRPDFNHYGAGWSERINFYGNLTEEKFPQECKEQGQTPVTVANTDPDSNSGKVAKTGKKRKNAK